MMGSREHTQILVSFGITLLQKSLLCYHGCHLLVEYYCYYLFRDPVEDFFERSHVCVFCVAVPIGVVL